MCKVKLGLRYVAVFHISTCRRKHFLDICLSALQCVEVNKVLRGKILKKRCHFRIEHVSQSKCRLDFLKRVKDNEVKKAAAKKAGQKNIVLKRIPGQPRSGEFIDASNVEIIKPAAYEFLV